MFFTKKASRPGSFGGLASHLRGSFFFGVVSPQLMHGFTTTLAVSVNLPGPFFCPSYLPAVSFGFNGVTESFAITILLVIVFGDPFGAGGFTVGCTLGFGG